MEWRRIRWLRLLGVLLAAFLLFCPTLILPAWGGWLRIIGVAALLLWLGLAAWVLEAWLVWRQEGDEYI